MLASAIRNSMTVVASNVCSDRVALASSASSDWAIAEFSSTKRRTCPHRSSVQLAVPSSVAEVLTPLPVLLAAPVPV